MNTRIYWESVFGKPIFSSLLNLQCTRVMLGKRKYIHSKLVGKIKHNFIYNKQYNGLMSLANKHDSKTETYSKLCENNTNKYLFEDKYYNNEESQCAIKPNYELNGQKNKNKYKQKILKSLILLKNKRKRDCDKLKLISKYIFNNINNYDIFEITNILYCTYFFSIILKKEDLYKLIKRLKLLTFNNKNDAVIYELILNLLRLKIPNEIVDTKFIFDLNIFLNNLLRIVILHTDGNTMLNSRINQSISYFNYIYFVREIQLIYHHGFCSWFNKKYLDTSILQFLNSFQSSLMQQNKNLDYHFINNVVNILYKLNCQVNYMNLYNYDIPIFIEEFNLIIECISDKNTFEGTLIMTPYFLQRYNLFKRLNYKVLFLYKELLPPKNEQDKINYIKKLLYDIIK
ncbi:conserved Plasmodium protein, unknown function [Plasmodium berghei]|uniref:RAP protein n=2 Tax=Plasmodium berghei TaxID=5821 RepID=A0A509AIZ4_PLABA|nr:conserved Plasmodium protein, unknown function [Plasmodium berghei ANKA]CXI16549.1 conserved Plasmodium protein, unknown function [Plasmodium berghei]SCM19634.1 conserved Plasmodium protein, unknown function [Plasmodium berghei]SCN23377.1 conserved Plasmodium protein, unknown function [Plasmodium berghei]SCO59052.1 conserved Plasmodium protein, unknown function [Plasmodium berghei]SCO59647.1 conserved Plasmodium protein, unknown function [Plasmodium berghei]|eukprot:XP_034420565.1 conserved Plasmodium protein, unknown function [Plasmodium berghei ANKA]